jgi:hypothetical protein
MRVVREVVATGFLIGAWLLIVSQVPISTSWLLLGPGAAAVRTGILYRSDRWSEALASLVVGLVATFLIAVPLFVPWSGTSFALAIAIGLAQLAIGFSVGRAITSLRTRPA